MNFVKWLPVVPAGLILAACGVPETSTPTPAAEADSDAWVQNDQALSAHGTFETFTGQDGKTYFHLLAGNGERVLASQGYSSVASALNGIESVKDNGTEASKYLMREASDGSWYFVIVASNGEIVATSEMYGSQTRLNRAMVAIAAIVKATTNEGAALTGAAKFEVFKGLDSKYYFDVRALNGEIVLQSQGYTARTSALNGALSVQTNGRDATRYVVLSAADGSSYFNLKAANGAIIARSELYATQYNAERGVQGCVNLLQADLPH